MVLVDAGAAVEVMRWGSAVGVDMVIPKDKELSPAMLAQGNSGLSSAHHLWFVSIGCSTQGVLR